MVQADFIAFCVHRNFHLIANVREPLFVLGHHFVDGFRDFGFHGQLKRFALAHPQQLFKISTALLNRMQHITPVFHQIAQQRDHIQKRRFAAGIRTNQRAKPAKCLIH